MSRIASVGFLAILFIANAVSGAVRPNIVLLVADDQRPDTIAALGNAHLETPHLDRLVRAGTSFTRAVTAYPICVQSRLELLTGCCVFRAAGYDPRRTERTPTPSWAQALQQAGYQTWYVGKWHNVGRPSDWGYSASRGLFAGGAAKHARPAVDSQGRPVTGYVGWAFQDDAGKLDLSQPVGLTPTISERFADAVIEVIERQSEGDAADQPFFLHVNFTAPHDPLLLPPGYETKYDPDRLPLPANFMPEHPFDHGNLRGRDELLFEFPRTPPAVRRELAEYYSLISHLDAQIGRLLAVLDRTGQRERTLVIFTSDHGLALGSHGLHGKQNMYDHTVGVPLVIAGHGVPRDHRSVAQVYLRDLYPTTCALAGATVAAGLDGVSFANHLTADAEGRKVEPPHEFIVGYYLDVQRMIRTERWKWIEYPQAGRTQLFDLATDPDETHDLSADLASAPMAATLRRKLHDWLRQHDDPLENEPRNK